jgi:hypothetical protein
VTTDREQYLLERCLRLEARIAVLEGHAVAPMAPEVAGPPAARMQLRRRIQRRANASDIAQMRLLRRRGLTPAQIGRQLGFSDTTTRAYTRDVLCEREVGAR